MGESELGLFVLQKAIMQYNFKTAVISKLDSKLEKKALATLQPHCFPAEMNTGHCSAPNTYHFIAEGLQC